MQIYLHMENRSFWVKRIEEAWGKRSVIWLTGVRRAGKTILSQSLKNVEYFDCELPRVRKEMEDPESFLKSLSGKRIVLDEIHRLPNPSELLKIAADHFKKTKVLATGSSTLEASSKFKDTLTGRKEEIWLTPMNSQDLIDFENENLIHRLHFGGLPPFFLEKTIPEKEFQEWMDSYWAKDIQELFRLEKKYSFQKFIELIFINSGGIFEANSYAAPCGISRTSIANYLSILEATHVAHVIRPYAKNRSSEIVAAPKVYGFDTGFIAYYRGWHTLRTQDLGILWEHYVLNELQSRLQEKYLIHYWRDKRGHEIDFVLLRRGKAPIALECKWSADSFDPQGISSFRIRYPEGKNWVIAHDVQRTYSRKVGNFTVEYTNLAQFIQKMEEE